MIYRDTVPASPRLICFNNFQYRPTCIVALLYQLQMPTNHASLLCINANKKRQETIKSMIGFLTFYLLFALLFLLFNYFLALSSESVSTDEPAFSSSATALLCIGIRQFLLFPNSTIIVVSSTTSSTVP